MKCDHYMDVVEKARLLFEKANIVLTEQEKANIEVADFGLNDIYNTGLELVVYVNTERCCAKELALLPGQTCAEHRHPAFDDYEGKEETFRCRYGTVYLFVEGEPADTKIKPPAGTEQYYTVWKEIKLEAGEQYTLLPDTKHWFQAGEMGAVVSEFSTKSYDEKDIFTNPNIKR